MRIGLLFKDGLGMLLAAAKLRAIELHDCAAVARLIGRPFHPATPIEQAFNHAEVVVVGDGFALIADCDMETDDFENAREAIGHFAVEVGVHDDNGREVAVLESVGLSDLAEAADELGVSLPAGAGAIFAALVAKHAPPPYAGPPSRCVCGRKVDRCGERCRRCFYVEGLRGTGLARRTLRPRRAPASSSAGGSNGSSGSSLGSSPDSSQSVSPPKRHRLAA